MIPIQKDSYMFPIFRPIFPIFLGRIIPIFYYSGATQDVLLLNYIMLYIVNTISNHVHLCVLFVIIKCFICVPYTDYCEWPDPKWLWLCSGYPYFRDCQVGNCHPTKSHGHLLLACWQDHHVPFVYIHVPLNGRAVGWRVAECHVCRWLLEWLPI